MNWVVEARGGRGEIEGMDGCEGGEGGVVPWGSRLLPSFFVARQGRVCGLKNGGCGLWVRKVRREKEGFSLFLFSLACAGLWALRWVERGGTLWVVGVAYGGILVRCFEIWV